MIGRTALTYILLSWLLLQCAGQEEEESTTTVDESLDQLRDALHQKHMVVSQLARHVMLSRMQDEERIRAEGDSGIVQVRSYHQGPANYYYSSHTGHGFAAIHDHIQYPDTLGMGEVIAVLNGVQFRTRHNDYLLRRPSSTSKEWHATEPISPPPVPKTVLDQRSVEDQITEMQAYFRAFKQQDSSIRAYKDYFKPVLCYLEGTWLSNYTDIEEAFESHRNHYNAFSWEDMAERARIEAYLGSVTSRHQNTAQLPTTIVGVDEETNEPIYAQWNYRILCMPVERDIPTSYFKLMDDVSYRFPRGIPQEEQYNKRGAHFVLDENEEAKYYDSTLLDEIASTIPGMDNVPGMLTENDLGLPHSKQFGKSKTLNLGFYNRLYKHDTDAMNYGAERRGFSDANLYVALTTQPQVAPLMVTQCERQDRCRRNNNIKASWMIPLEFVYLTPLTTWNPYNFAFKEGPDADSVTANSRRGYDEKTALDGTKLDYFYRTPLEFFAPGKGHPEDRDQSDTVAYSRWVMNDKAKAYRVAASGPRTVTPEIPEVGGVRLRFPIAPIHGQGAAVWKELNAFKDYLTSQILKVSEFRDGN